MAAHPEDYAIVVGINRYQHIKGLQGARRDSIGFRKWLLQDPPFGGGLAAEHIFPGREIRLKRVEPGLEEMSGAFRVLLRAAGFGQHRLGRRLYVFLSGHGVGEDRVDDTALLAPDASTEDPRRLVGAVWADLFMKAGIFDEVVLFMDCCREVAGWTLQPADPGIVLNLDGGLPRTVRRFYAYATGYGLLAREHDWGKGIFRGVFTRSLLEGLVGGAADDDGCVTSTGLREYLGWRMDELRPETKQSPSFPAQEHIVFVDGLRRPRTRVEVALVTSPEQGFVVLNSGLEVCSVPQRRIAENVFDVELIAGRKYVLAIPGDASEEFRKMKVIRVRQESFRESL